MSCEHRPANNQLLYGQRNSNSMNYSLDSSKWHCKFLRREEPWKCLPQPPSMFQSRIDHPLQTIVMVSLNTACSAYGTQEYLPVRLFRWHRRRSRSRSRDASHLSWTAYSEPWGADVTTCKSKCGMEMYKNWLPSPPSDSGTIPNASFYRFVSQWPTLHESIRSKVRHLICLFIRSCTVWQQRHTHWRSAFPRIWQHQLTSCWLCPLPGAHSGYETADLHQYLSPAKSADTNVLQPANKVFHQKKYLFIQQTVCMYYKIHTVGSKWRMIS